MPAYTPSGRPPSLPARGGIRVAARKMAGADASCLIDDEGRFEGYASLFGIADLGRDVVMPGAFRQCLAHRTPPAVKLLFQHDARLPIGRWDRIEEDRHGLHVAGRLDLDLPKARDLHRLISRGAIDGLSIGYRTQTERRDGATGLRRLEKLDLWEISIVTFPLLPQARISARKDGRSTGSRTA